MSKRRISIKAVVFALIFSLLFAGVIQVFGVGDDIYDNRGRIRSFYDEPENTIDVALLGASSIYRGWSSMVAWKGYGITSYAWSTSAQPTYATIYIMEEIRKTQQPKVFVLDMRNIHGKPDPKVAAGTIRKVVDNMPFSFNRIFAIYYMVDIMGVEANKNNFEYVFSFYQFHNRWDGDLTKADFKKKENRIKGTRIGDEIFKVKPTTGPAVTSEQAILYKTVRENLLRTIAYIKEHDLPVLFLALPFKANEKEVKRINAVTAILESEGLPYLNMLDRASEIGIDYDRDFFDRKHLNFRGMQKATDWLSQYLDAQYDLPDHRGEPAYVGWGEAYEEYLRQLKGKAMEDAPDAPLTAGQP